MERFSAKIFLILFIITALLWQYSVVMKNYIAGTMLEFGTVTFREDLQQNQEEENYRAMAEHSVIVFAAYPLALVFWTGYLKSTVQSTKREGWLMMSAILLFIFIPVELYCFWLDWKIVGLSYWGDWPVEEFRKAFLNRMTALAGLPFVAQLCYFTIPIFAIFKPLSKND